MKLQTVEGGKTDQQLRYLLPMIGIRMHPKKAHIQLVDGNITFIPCPSVSMYSRYTLSKSFFKSHSQHK